MSNFIILIIINQLKLIFYIVLLQIRPGEFLIVTYIEGDRNASGYSKYPPT